ncbi:hypothetical protein [Glaesserella parasuis]|uniref:Uncharacterized protein n=1 Tax=Glaesserella parasuis serovar 5 (strain SH0165) TaxID=557723 RepID=B8F4G4_GLAP5|nr:hypothetical protein [Glaesserella parasuis]ACL32216.1 hypothetical protein HAPS_0562 [Glaesserella parasuis SH0165]MDG6281257.1 hypothetical protein [Glaesserella parasuis]MDG6289569.1 hypothetical protein [Glaesserella parasuis]MDG6291638.1 hypothetical protein [Glaesserella parasuis]MDG6313052.1 hypothetical protein [Glaesserella parasuis]
MKDIEIMKKVTPEILANYLNTKGASLETFRCPICGRDHITIIDNQPFESSGSKVEISGVGTAVMQTILPTVLYPRHSEFNHLIENGLIDSSFHYLGNLITHMSANNSVILPVIHMICDNCGNIRTFSKAKILEWIAQQEGEKNE